MMTIVNRCIVSTCYAKAYPCACLFEGIAPMTCADAIENGVSFTFPET